MPDFGPRCLLVYTAAVFDLHLSVCLCSSGQSWHLLYCCDLLHSHSLEYLPSSSSSSSYAINHFILYGFFVLSMSAPFLFFIDWRMPGICMRSVSSARATTRQFCTRIVFAQIVLVTVRLYLLDNRPPHAPLASRPFHARQSALSLTAE